MRRRSHIATILTIAVPIVSLLPLGMTIYDWARLSILTADTSMGTSTSRSFDWVAWSDRDGPITAEYVFPSGTAAEAGLQNGDVFYMLDFQQYFSLATLQRAVEGIKPGNQIKYSVLRDGRQIDVAVDLTRYPTFLYPLSPGVWNFSIWGFMVAGFIHLLGLIAAGPIAFRSDRARLSLTLIVVSGLWILGNLARIAAIELLGPPMPGTAYANVFQILTLVGLVGWIGFPVLLVRSVVADAAAEGTRPSRSKITLLYAPAAILALAAIASILLRGIGPITLDRLVSPILFYACCYIALAAVLVLVCFSPKSNREVATGSQSRVGNGIMLVVAVFAALTVIGIVPLAETVTESTAGWLVVGTQLLSTVPVVLVSLTTLRFGRIDRLVSRALTYVAILGLIFFAFVGIMALIDPVASARGWPRNVVGGILVVLLLLLFERFAMRARAYFTQFFATERERAARVLDEFQDRIRDFVELDALMSESVQVAGQAFNVRSAVLFIQTAETPETWTSASFRPQPPYLTERVVRSLWTHFKHEGKVWALNPELNLSTLPADDAERLIERGAALAIPIKGKDEPVGLLVLGRKHERRAVYNLEDVDRLRSFAGHLALAIERLELVERQKELVRESSEAQLKALRAQINPHFLFNALNTIAASIDERPELAELTVESLAHIFRHILQTGDRPFVTLGSELSLARSYLGIEKARFGDKLHVEIDVGDDLLDYTVPAFAIQTLVENAVKHGLEKARAEGAVKVTAAYADGELSITVSDTGVGIPALFNTETERLDTEGDRPPDTNSFFGIGLRNVTARLEYLYGRMDLLEITSKPGRGTTVVLRVPNPHPADPFQMTGANTSDLY